MTTNVTEFATGVRRVTSRDDTYSECPTEDDKTMVRIWRHPSLALIHLSVEVGSTARVGCWLTDTQAVAVREELIRHTHSMTTETDGTQHLYDYETGHDLGPAIPEQVAASDAAAELDDHHGVYVDETGRAVYTA